MVYEEAVVYAYHSLAPIVPIEGSSSSVNAYSTAFLDMIAVALPIVVFAVVWAITHHRGHIVQVATTFYVASLVATALLMSTLIGRQHFRYPAWVTASHTTSALIFSLLYWIWHGDLRRFLPSSMGGSTADYATFILPIAISMPMSIVLNNSSLLYIGAGLQSIIGALSPAVTALCSQCAGRRIPEKGWLGLGVALLGALIVSIEEVVSFSNKKRKLDMVIFGASLCFSALFLRSFKVVLQDRLMNNPVYRKPADEVPLVVSAAQQQKQPLTSLSPMHVWALQAPILTVASIAYAVCTESFAGAYAELKPQMAMSLFLSCISATTLNMLGMVVIKELGPTLMQLIGKLNAIVIVATSVLVFGESLPRGVLIGGSIMMCGICMYELRTAEPAKST
jgi:drug/metabolite transporter (DMT)-like permease